MQTAPPPNSSVIALAVATALVMAVAHRTFFVRGEAQQGRVNVKAFHDLDGSREANQQSARRWLRASEEKVLKATQREASGREEKEGAAEGRGAPELPTAEGSAQAVQGIRGFQCRSWLTILGYACGEDRGRQPHRFALAGWRKQVGRDGLASLPLHLLVVGCSCGDG